MPVDRVARSHPRKMSLGRLREPLPLHDPATVVRVRALARVGLEHRRLGLLDLEEQRVALVATLHVGDPAPGPDAADPDDLARHVHAARTTRAGGADPAAGSAR